ncbi:phage terminase large subunit-like protein [Paraburkholderia bannensis]|uniref:Phage terminase large subunit-like protein n=1 Tax=Paraburkholderia bannensis TaxID=765414 RepID=A0A7W9U1A6_9BURK|nr:MULTISPECIES: terminase TerL endonuclease subunit [Paraburkholderia]MBB3259992.1 phage terminase large subunit-like protein [Paraburkholderia sp. WP4_3_2]MBB6105198.1 phage terminase large subunit-like protein [Paraburkholderia bannensis]
MVGEFVFLAVLRHYEDLESGAARGIIFSAAHAWHCINWIETQFHHIKGKDARTPLVLDPWQRFFTAVLFGWRRAATMLRRFRTGYEEVARKNGKSTWKAGIADYLFLMDREIGAEVYTIATTREQAMSVFKPALENYKRRAKRSPRFARSVKIYDGTNQERVTANGGVFKPLPANAESLDGLNPSAIVVDELHAHRTREVWDVMESALGARLQPLISAITTAGYILDGICTEIRGYLVSILRGDVQDDTFFGYIFTLDDGDDPFDPAVWPKANPSLGSAKTHEYMVAQATKAKELPSSKANYLTKDLNVWVNGAMSWFDIRVWDEGGTKFIARELAGRRCFGGLDLSSTRDLTSFVLVFPPDDEDGEWHVLAWVFCPQSKVAEQSKSDAAPYAKWKEQGWLIVTEGDVLDYKVVRSTVLQACRVFDVEEIAFDVWNATHLANELLEEDVPMVQLPQNFGGLSPGSKLLERLVYGRRLRHNANPVLRWCASNVSLLLDTNENIRPNKKTSEGRIDPIVATCMAMTRALVHQPEPAPEIIAI